MTKELDREAVDALVADVMAEHFERFRADLDARIERLIAAKPIPPFNPPPVWTEGRHGAGSVVRAHNGIFYAKRDTTDKPGDSDGAWLPLVVGVAGFDLRWLDDRRLVCFVRLSDGTIIETERKLPVPIVRGNWDAATPYDTGDRVFRFGEFCAIEPSTGIDPTAPGAESHWLKVGGKYARALALAFDDDGNITENGRTLGNLTPIVVRSLDAAIERYMQKRPGKGDRA
jgi:hypothetical protein